MLSNKTKNVLFTFGIGFTLIGIVLFMVIPLICSSGFSYSGPEAFLAGLKAIVSFNFKETLYTLFFVLGVITILISIWWLVLVLKHKSKGSFVKFLFCFIFILGIINMTMVYFVAPVTFNDKESQLFTAILDLHGEQDLGMWLSMIVIGLFYVGLMFMTLYALIDIYTLHGVKEVVPAPAVVEEAVSEETCVEPVVEEKPEEFDDRKPREEALFANLIATGNYTEYVEFELEEPIPHATEEPILELVTVVETSKFVKGKPVIYREIQK